MATPKKLLVTGSSGLIGSEVCYHFAGLGWEIHGVDNNQRAVFLVPRAIPAGTKTVSKQT
jgi:nucleoside-diphosphate-sugar epimerase